MNKQTEIQKSAIKTVIGYLAAFNRRFIEIDDYYTSASNQSGVNFDEEFETLDKSMIIVNKLMADLKKQIEELDENSSSSN